MKKNVNVNVKLVIGIVVIIIIIIVFFLVYKKREGFMQGFMPRFINPQDLIKQFESHQSEKPKRDLCNFDARRYADAYPDLKNAFGYDEVQLKRHYEQYGAREGRSPCGVVSKSDPMEMERREMERREMERREMERRQIEESERVRRQIDENQEMVRRQMGNLGRRFGR